MIKIELYVMLMIMVIMLMITWMLMMIYKCNMMKTLTMVIGWMGSLSVAVLVISHCHNQVQVFHLSKWPPSPYQKIGLYSDLLPKAFFESTSKWSPKLAIQHLLKQSSL